ncbi:periplasmic binding protein-like I [Lobosporangium transversale]|uniref:Periplasmic binding protein-like I n=1 Tax=Lobosporangium transversale TaxID=64571 RepID=A0A1Y2GZD9_9FUNG|nr:periplasmic binding protein-like I [Lobosporangium transversale]ORZ27121.1 periplasmic binding protein-like I [Lobosporangium transversale]|eukprot:XP_021884868.1 periplasmic binding protein-like I [Lobosporangium transversale]
MRSPLLLLTLAISRIFSVAYIVPFAFVRLPENIYVSASAHNNNNGLRPTPCLVFPAHTFLSLDQSLPIAAQSEPTASSILVPRRHDAAALDGTRQPTASLHTILPSTTNSAVSKASPLIPTKIQPPPLSATDFSSTKVGAKYSAATISLRPKTKPHLLTDYEYETMWDPDVETLRFGVLLPLNAPTGSREHIIARKALSAIRLAINHVNRQKIVPGINMTLILRDSQDPDLFTITGGSAAISAASDLITAKVSGVIGDLRSSLTRYEALMTSSVGIPQCSFSSVSTTLSDMRVYPFFFRTIPTLIVILDSLLALVHTLGWRRISLIYDADTLGWSEREHFEDKAKEMGIYVLAAVPMTIFGKPYDPTFHHVKDKLQSSRSRIQVLIATQNNQFDFLREMKDSGYMSPKYAWITTNDVSSSVQQEKDSIPDYDGLIMIDNGWDLKGYGPFDNFLSEWQNLDPTEYPLAQDPILVNNEGMAYSCVMMIAQAYGKLIRSTITNPAHRMPTHPFIKSLIGGEHTGKVQVLDIFGNDSYSGPNGPISLDPSGDRKEGYFVFSSMRKGVSVQFAKHFFGDLILSSLPFFKDGYPNLLDDTPPGIIQNPRWTNPSGIILGILSIIGILLTLLSAALVVHYRNYIVIKATSPTFCICELFGILLMMVWCILRIGIPRHGECAAEVFILPIGGAFFAGSLAIKNYRIYRIFNSVKAIKQEFQTRTLIRYLVVAVILSTIPPVVQVIVEMPTYEELNIEAKQWIRCNGTRHQTQWLISSLAVPIVLIIFGVFLAFKTRNVMFLWNEAKQISFVIYNAFFFLIMIVASHFFPIEFYPATFYLTYIGIYSIALLSLLILFAPKFWEIWKSQHQTWTSSRALHIYSQHPHHLGGNGGGIFGSSNALGRVPDGLRANQSASMGSHDIPMSVLESPARTARTNSAHDALKNNIDGCTKPTTTSSNYTSYDIHGGDVTGPRLPALNNIKLQGSYTANSDGTRAIAAISDEPLYARVLYGRTLGTKTSEGSRMLKLLLTFFLYILISKSLVPPSNSRGSK